MSTTAIDTDRLSLPALLALHDHDKQMVGTDAYLGIAYFWAYEYRYPMRDLSYAARRRVHALMLERGLSVNGESDEHRQAIHDGLTARDRERLHACYGEPCAWAWWERTVA